MNEDVMCGSFLVRPTTRRSFSRNEIKRGPEIRVRGADVAVDTRLEPAPLLLGVNSENVVLAVNIPCRTTWPTPTAGIDCRHRSVQYNNTDDLRSMIKMLRTQDRESQFGKLAIFFSFYEMTKMLGH